MSGDRSQGQRLWRRALNSMAVSVIKLVNDSGGVQKAQVSHSALETRDDVPILYHYGFTSVPLPGAIASTVFIAGDRSGGVVIGINDQRYRLKGLQGGDVAMYDNLGGKFLLGREELVIDGGGRPIKVIGDLRVTGAVIAGFETGDQVSLQTHEHTQPGDSHGDTEQPTNAPIAGT